MSLKLAPDFLIQRRVKINKKFEEADQVLQLAEERIHLLEEAGAAEETIRGFEGFCLSLNL